MHAPHAFIPLSHARYMYMVKINLLIHGTEDIETLYRSMYVLGFLRLIVNNKLLYICLTYLVHLTEFVAKDYLRN